MDYIKRPKKLLFIIIAIVFLVVAAATTYALFRLNKQPTEQPQKTDDKPQIIVDDTDQNQKPTDTTNDAESKPAIACSDGNNTILNFTLSADAFIYNTANDAKQKTNPAGTYHAGNYMIFKCFDGMANITKTTGSPGGWINPSSPYSNQTTTPEPVVPDPVSTNIMSLDNTTFNWSHEYPSAFVSQYEGFWNIPGNNLYLTFDCGYDYNNLASTIMDTLKTKNIKAVFFVTGDFINDRPDLILRMVSEGHVVGNHSYSHLNQPQNLTLSTDIIVDDLQAWQDKYFSIVGSKPNVNYFRPPAGAISVRSMGLMSELGYKTLMWGTAYNDWNTSAQPSAETAMELLRKYTSAGDIVLLHGISETSTSILSQYIDEYSAKGFEFKLF